MKELILTSVLYCGLVMLISYAILIPIVTTFGLSGTVHHLLALIIGIIASIVEAKKNS